MPECREYNLVSEPWIRVLDESGAARTMSLLRLFEEAGDIRVIAGEVPTQDVAILRLCLAILHRALEPYAPSLVDDIPDVVEGFDACWDTGALPAIRDYLRAHEERFDIFHPQAPFFQTVGLRTAKGEVSELAKIIADMPAGRPYLTMRSACAASQISAAEAARWLVHAQAYDPSGIKTGVVGHPRAKSGKAYPEGPAWTGQLGLVHLVGDSVKRTLLLNLWAALLSDDERGLDLPPWERPPQTVEYSEDLNERPAGPVDLYTWQPRRILLQGSSEGVTGVLVTYGDRFILQDRQDVVKREPMSLWRYSEPQSAKYKRPIQMTKKHRPGVALWRGLGSVLPSSAAVSDKPQAAPCLLVNHAAELRSSSLLRGGIVRYRAVGMDYGSNESVIDEIVEDSLDLPSLVLDPAQSGLRRIALDAVTTATAGVVALARLARGLARASGASGDATAGPGDRAFESGFAALDEPYRRWLRDSLVAAVDEPLAAERHWHVIARRILSDLGQSMVATVPDKAWVGYDANGKRDDVGAVYQRFRRDLGRAFPRARVPVLADQGAPNVTEEGTFASSEGSGQ